MIAKVLVDVNVKQLNRPFDYLVPNDIESLIEIGARVIVPFGARQLMGFVIKLEDDSPLDTKPIIKLLDIKPALTKELLILGEQVAKDTTSNLVTVYKLMLPAGLRIDITSYVIQDEKKVLLSTLSSKELQALKKSTTEVFYDFKQKASPETRTKVLLADPTYQPTSTAQNNFLSLLTTEDDAVLLKKQAGASAYKTLLQKGVIKEIKQERFRNIDLIPDSKQVTLTKDQQQALSELKPGGNLLFGVTGSGKTEVYLSAIEQALKSKKSAIFLVPEISLTYQTVARLVGRFGEEVAILHSGLSTGERYDEWRRIRTGKAKVVVGARSAIFAPLENIGLIIVDEEHDASYKQEDTPRYHAREVAIQRAKTHNAILLLGSATPSVETFARAQKGVYQLLRLPDRFGATMPTIELVDLTEHPGILSEPLKAAIERSLANNEQVLLLQNRRGFHNYMLCQACGEVPKCPDCDVSLTYHQKAHSMICHYCGYKTTPPTTCAMCNSDQLDYHGVGTEQLEAVVKELYPHVKVLRMDKDTTSTKQAHETLLTAFEAREYQVLVGTQMIAKGLDFTNVGLVGVIDVDSMLHLPDFHSSERTYQLLTQVAGRAGRHLVPGHVMIQTYNPDHYAIQAVLADYETFYHQEMKYRQLAGYVPYYYVELLLLQGDVFQTVFQEAMKVKTYLQQHVSDKAIILGPVVPSISRLRQKYRVQLVLKYKRETGLEDVYASIVSLIRDGVDITIDRTPNYIG